MESHQPTEASSVPTSLPGLNSVYTPTSMQESVRVRAGQHAPASSPRCPQSPVGSEMSRHTQNQGEWTRPGEAGLEDTVSPHAPSASVRRTNGKLRLRPSLVDTRLLSSPPRKGQHSPGGSASTPAQNERDETRWSAKGPVGNFLPRLFSLVTAGSNRELLLPTSGLHSLPQVSGHPARD